MQSGYTILEHPADIGIEARGRTLAETFVYAATGMMSVIIDPASVECFESREVILNANDTEQLLVRWLGEILYQFDGKAFVVKEFEIEQITATEMRGVLRGEPFQAEKHRTRVDVKAVTYHQLLVRKEERGWYARYFLDL